jgi:starvation-inducible DNA-binding protein
MEELSSELKKVLADTFAFALKAQNFHWNVEGQNFLQFHKFFGKLYEDSYEAADAIAEHIRTLNAYAPGSFSRFKDLTSIQDEINVPSAMSMVIKLTDDNAKVISILTSAMKIADKIDKANISDFLQSRIDIHEKHGWMLRAISKA